jgi:predicted phosphoribosyltransferase
MRYRNRADAGRVLAAHLTAYAGRNDVSVLGLPRGGVPVAAEIAGELPAPLDVFLVRKLGVPGFEELAMGAIAEGGVEVVNPDVVRGLDIPRSAIDRVVAREKEELAQRAARYRGQRPFPDVAGRIVILVDDGLATGATMEAGVLALRQLSPARIVVAAPVGARETCARLAAIADEVVCPSQPEAFDAVGLWYDDFRQTTDEEVQAVLQPTL